MSTRQRIACLIVVLMAVMPGFVQGQLIFTDNISQFGVYWYSPERHPIANNPPPGVNLPTFTGDDQIYGELFFGDSVDPSFHYAVDLFGLEENLSSVRFYFDRNKNNDLTDDGPALELPALVSGKITTFSIPYLNGEWYPYSFKVYVYFADWDQTYHVVYYRHCAWTGNVDISPNHQNVAMFLLDDNSDGVYDLEGNRWNCDYICVDLNGDGIPLGGQKGERIRIFDPFYIGNDSFRVKTVAANGGYVTFEVVPVGTLSGIITSNTLGACLAGVKIEAWTTAERQTSTNIEGVYSIDLAEGIWTVRASLPGFIPVLSDNVNITAEQTTNWNADLVPIPVPCMGTVTLYGRDSYDFAKSERGTLGGGDFYYSNNSKSFWANNRYQRGLQDIGDIGQTPLDEVVLPTSGYWRQGVPAIVGHTYVSLAREGEEGGYIVFRVISITDDSVTLDFYFICPTPVPPPPPPDPLSEALDTALSFTTGGSADWFSQTTTFYYDEDAAQSGDISDDQESWMQTTVSGKGTLKFYWIVSSEEEYDCLEFYIDGVLQEKISGLVEYWEQKTYTISTSGSHTLEWRYMKDGTTSYGSDCGWVDKVEWVTN